MGILIIVVIFEVLRGYVDERFADSCAYGSGIPDDNWDRDSLFDSCRCGWRDKFCGVIRVLVAIQNIFASVVRRTGVGCKNADFSPVEAGGKILIIEAGRNIDELIVLVFDGGIDGGFFVDQRGHGINRIGDKAAAHLNCGKNDFFACNVTSKQRLARRSENWCIEHYLAPPTLR